MGASQREQGWQQLTGVRIEIGTRARGRIERDEGITGILITGILITGITQAISEKN